MSALRRSVPEEDCAVYFTVFLFLQESQGSKPRSCVADEDPAILSDKFDKLEKELKALLNDPKALKQAWAGADYNGNGISSLAELDK